MLSAPAKRALEKNGLTTLKKIAGITEKQILSLHGIGPSSLLPIKEALNAAGLTFKAESVDKESTETIKYHKNGTIWAKGKMRGDQLDGYWEWFRKDGMIMRSGYFNNGKQVGEWITYDKLGKVYKITQMK